MLGMLYEPLNDAINQEAFDRDVTNKQLILVPMAKEYPNLKDLIEEELDMKGKL